MMSGVKTETMAESGGVITPDRTCDGIGGEGGGEGVEEIPDQTCSQNFKVTEMDGEVNGGVYR